MRSAWERMVLLMAMSLQMSPSRVSKEEGGCGVKESSSSHLRPHISRANQSVALRFQIIQRRHRSCLGRAKHYSTCIFIAPSILSFPFPFISPPLFPPPLLDHDRQALARNPHPDKNQRASGSSFPLFTHPLFFLSNHHSPRYKGSTSNTGQDSIRGQSSTERRTSRRRPQQLYSVFSPTGRLPTATKNHNTSKNHVGRRQKELL